MTELPSVDDLMITVRVANCLANVRIKTMEELLACSEADLLLIPNFGRKSLQEVVEELRRLGVSLSPTGHRDREEWRRRCYYPWRTAVARKPADQEFIHQDQT